MFRLSSEQLRALDEELNTTFSERCSQICDDLFPAKSVGRGIWNKANWLRAKLERITRHPELIDALKTAAVESVPIHKLREFGRAFQLLRKYFIDRCPPSEEIGEDELLPVTIAFVVITNPPAITSNLAYITHFCVAPEFGALFHQELVQPLSVLRIICKYLHDSQMLIDTGCLAQVSSDL
jgi:hypothetical protein